jgi:hypothetical protein
MEKGKYDTVNENDRLEDLYSQCRLIFDTCGTREEFIPIVLNANVLIEKGEGGSLHDHVVLIWAFLYLIQKDQNAALTGLHWMKMEIPMLMASKLGAWHDAINEIMAQDAIDWLDCDASTSACGAGLHGVHRHIIISAFRRSIDINMGLSQAESAFVTASVLSVLKTAKGLNLEDPSGGLYWAWFSTDPSEFTPDPKIPTDLIGYHYEAIQRCLYSDRLKRMPVQERDEMGYNDMFQCVAQGPNTSCFAAAALNLFINTPAIMQRVEGLRKTDDSVQHLWTELKELERSGGGLPNILGPSCPAGWTKQERRAGKTANWSANRFTRALWEGMDRRHRVENFEGGQPVPIMKGMLGMIGIPVIYPSEVGPDTWPIVKIGQYNPLEHLRNLYIAMHAPVSEFLGVFLWTNNNNHVALEIPYTDRDWPQGQVDTDMVVVCDSNCMHTVCKKLQSLEGDAYRKYRNFDGNATDFVWYFEDGAYTSAVHYTLEVKSAFDYTLRATETYDDTHMEMSNDFFHSVPIAYTKFITENLQISNFMIISAKKCLRRSLMNPNKAGLRDQSTSDWYQNWLWHVHNKIVPASEIRELIEYSFALAMLTTSDTNMDQIDQISKKNHELLPITFSAPFTKYQEKLKRIREIHAMCSGGVIPWQQRTSTVSSNDNAVENLSERVLEFMGAMGTLGPIYKPTTDNPAEFSSYTDVAQVGRRKPCDWHPCHWFEPLQSLGGDTLYYKENREAFLSGIISTIFDDYPCRVLGFVETFIIMVVSKVKAAVVCKKALQLIADASDRSFGIGDAAFHSERWETNRNWSALDELYLDVERITRESAKHQVGNTRPRSECGDPFDWPAFLVRH